MLWLACAGGTGRAQEERQEDRQEDPHAKPQGKRTRKAAGAKADGQRDDHTTRGERRSPPDAATLAQARRRFERGLAFYREGKLGAARDELEAARALAPSRELTFNLARVNERMGDAERALSLYARYLRGVSSERERTEIAERMEQLRALRERQRAQTTRAPARSQALTGEARVFFERGQKLYRRGRLREALDAFTAARGFARFPELSYNLALVSERLGETRDAIDHYRAYLREAPDAADAQQVRERIRTLQRR
ncbi:MAG: tetratricopeptide repeat protein [Myxococcales bacterium]